MENIVTQTSCDRKSACTTRCTRLDTYSATLNCAQFKKAPWVRVYFLSVSGMKRMRRYRKINMNYIEKNHFE